MENWLVERVCRHLRGVRGDGGAVRGRGDDQEPDLLRRDEGAARPPQPLLPARGQADGNQSG